MSLRQKLLLLVSLMVGAVVLAVSWTVLLRIRHVFEQRDQQPDSFEQHVQQFLDEYKPATPTEHHLVAELAGASWRLNRIPLLEAEVLTRAANPPNEQAAIDFDIVDAHRLLNSLSLHSNRLSRQFHKTLHELHQVQFQRREREVRELRDAAALLELHQQKGIPWEPAHDGFVFSIEEIERYALREWRLKQALAVVQGAPYSAIPSPNRPLTASTLAACS